MKGVVQVLRSLLLFASFFFFPMYSGPVQAQRGPVAYRLDKNNGLPTNHVYGSLVDHLGYLWLATPRGVVRYNGYEMKIFGVSNGLPKEDVWNLVEDSSGRIWLSTIANEYGYLYKGQYHAVFHDTALIYPRTTRRCGKGIVFINAAQFSPIQKKTTCTIYNGDADSVLSLKTPNDCAMYLSESLELIFLDRRNRVYQLVFDAPFFRWKFIRQLGGDDARKVVNGYMDLYRNHLYSFLHNRPEIWTLDLNGNTPPRNISPITEAGDVVNYTYYWQNNVHIFGLKRLYILDSLFRTTRSYSLAELSNGDIRESHTPSIYNEDAFWGQIFCTKNNGAYIRNRLVRALDPAALPELANAVLAGNSSDSGGYWWNESTRELLVVGTRGIVSRVHLPGIRNLLKVVPLPQQGLLLVGSDMIYLSDLHISRPRPLYTNFFAVSGIRLYDAAAATHDSVFVLQMGLERFIMLSTSANIYITIDDYWYHEIIHDQLRNGFWLYGDQKVCFYSLRENRCRTWNSVMLKLAGIRKIEGMAIDNRYGNVFLKEPDRIRWFHHPARPPRMLPTGTAGNNGVLKIQGGNLLFYGPFGIMQTAITGEGRLGHTTWLRNFRNLNYSSISDLQVLGKQLLLKTDEGTYRIPLPSAGTGSEGHSVVHPVRFIMTTGDSSFRVHNGDTVYLRPDQSLVQLDVINPVGTGALKLQCSFTGQERHSLDFSGRELSLAALGPGFHELRVGAEDEVWKSRELRLILRIKPHWWQEPYFPVLAVVLLLLTGSGLVVITRTVVLRRNARKQLLTEMALKGVHAQINPHFIFNTLSSTQYFIRSNRINEAYDHVNRFSRLLRNFLYASKHKYITIAEEIENLRSYIELQQTRFEQRFAYDISVGPGVDLQSRIPSLLLQPLVENAIQHGLLNKATAGKLSISFSRTQSLCIRIEDDGIGRKQAKKLQDQSTVKQESYGSDLLKSLLYLFNQYEKANVTLTYFDKEPPETGTLVEIIIHNQPR